MTCSAHGNKERLSLDAVEYPRELAQSSTHALKRLREHEAMVVTGASHPQG
ncbi:MAG: hypothetical protein ACI9DC_001274 [Gammaproteobacteria bacterium]|jgi:hypothetical protein